MEVSCEEPGNDKLDRFNEFVRIFMNENALRVPTNHMRQKVSIVNFSVSLMTFRNIDKMKGVAGKEKNILHH